MYEAFFKLRVSPFQLIPDSRFFYDSDTHRHALINLRRSVQNNKAMTFVYGEPGAGKTELLTKFKNEFEEQTTVVANIPLSSLRASNILDYVASAFGVINMGFVGDALWSKSALLGKVQQHVSTQTAEGKKFVIFIDNAESLNKNCYKKLLQLCSLESNGVALIQCFLFGDSSVVRHLNLDQKLNGKEISKINLQLLGEVETRRYIEHRLLEAGWQGDPEISTTAFNLIHQISEGVPWHVNLLCHRIFLQCFLENSHVIDERLVGMFAGDKHVVEQGVSGSDVTGVSNVVNLSSKSSGRNTKGISFISDEKPTNGDDDRFGQNVKDSISHFFEEPATTETLDDEAMISLTDVQHAFSQSIEQDEQLDTISRSVESAKTDELFFPKVNDRVEPTAVRETATTNKSIEESIVEVSRNENRLTESILERIFPKTVAMMGQYDRASPARTYPALEVPAAIQETAPNKCEKLQPAEIAQQAYDELPAPRSPIQIAARASIVTSLVITLVMWVISDARNVDQHLAKAADNGQDVNRVTPNPFQNPNDLPRSRAVLKQ